MCVSSCEQSKDIGTISISQSLELLTEKKRKFLGGSGSMLPQKIFKVETKICAI